MLLSLLLAAAPALAQSSSYGTTGSSGSTSTGSYTTPGFVPTLANRTHFARDVYHDIDAVMLRSSVDDWNRPTTDLLRVRGYDIYDRGIADLGFTIGADPAFQVWDGTVNVSTLMGLDLGDVPEAIADPAYLDDNQIGLVFAEKVAEATFNEHAVYFGAGGPNLGLEGFVFVRDEAYHPDWTSQKLEIAAEYPAEWPTAVYAMQSMHYGGLPLTAPTPPAGVVVFAFEVFQKTGLDEDAPYDLTHPVAYHLVERRPVGGKHKYVTHWAFTDDFVPIGWGDGKADQMIVYPVEGVGSAAQWIEDLNDLAEPPVVYTQVPVHSYAPLAGPAVLPP